MLPWKAVLKLARRYRRFARFRLPRVPGAKSVVKARRGDARWLARTDIDSREVEFSKHWAALPTSAHKRYIALHEQAHLRSSERHDDAFYAALKPLVERAGIPWKTAWELETANLPRGKACCGRV